MTISQLYQHISRSCATTIQSGCQVPDPVQCGWENRGSPCGILVNPHSCNGHAISAECSSLLSTSTQCLFTPSTAKRKTQNLTEVVLTQEKIDPGSLPNLFIGNCQSLTSRNGHELQLIFSQKQVDLNLATETWSKDTLIPIYNLYSTNGVKCQREGSFA